MFKISQTKSLDLVMQMLSLQSHGLRHALCAMLSVLVSTAQGIEHLCQPRELDLSVVERVVELVKDSEDGSVTQRFQLALLQKLSAQNSNQLNDQVTESVIDLMTKQGMISWTLELLKKSRIPNRDRKDVASIHAFCLDFSSALLANLLHASSTMEMLEADQK